MSTTICFYFYPLQIKAFAEQFHWFRVVVHGDERPLDGGTLEVACQYCTRGSNSHRKGLCTLAATHRSAFGVCVCAFHLVLLLTGFSFLFYWHHYLTACVASTHSSATGRISHFISFDDLRNGASFFMGSSTILFFFSVRKVHSHSRFMCIIVECCEKCFFPLL